MIFSHWDLEIKNFPYILRFSYIFYEAIQKFDDEEHCGL